MPKSKIKFFNWSCVGGHLGIDLKKKRREMKYPGNRDPLPTYHCYFCGPLNSLLLGHSLQTGISLEAQEFSHRNFKRFWNSVLIRKFQFKSNWLRVSEVYIFDARNKAVLFDVLRIKYYVHTLRITYYAHFALSASSKK